MQTRTVAGIGMTLLAAGLVTIFLLTYDPNEVPAPDAAPARGERPDPVRPGSPEEAQTFLDAYNEAYQAAWTRAEGAKFNAGADITAAHTAARIEADRALADFTGSRAVIERLRLFRDLPGLTELQERQIEVAWQLAAHAPATAPARVAEMLATEAVLTDSLYAFRYVLRAPGADPRPVTPNEIDAILRDSRDPALRRAAWDCSKTVGPKLKDGVEKLQGLRNANAREMGFSSFFGLEVADYGLTSAEMMALMDEILAALRPLYEQLHCWVRHELAARYGEPVPDLIPAHWLGNRWGQSWPGLVPAADTGDLLRDAEPQWLVEQAERFYLSLGFEPLPANFWARSDLYALPANATRRKNTHASAWHIDLDRDVRALMSIEPGFEWFQTTHHELGHVYYYLSYARPEVPMVLRRGANRAFHEGVGSLIELAASQRPYLARLDLVAAGGTSGGTSGGSSGDTPDEIAWLLEQALTGGVVFLPFACGTMTHWEHDLYEEDLPRHLYNTRWWELAARHQGIAPPEPRGEEHCDPATKTHVIDDPAQYYDYALSTVILHQLHRYICREILQADVHAADYYGNRAVGLYLESILRLGATRDWSRVMREATGEGLSADAMLEYFAPLQAWLEERNAGRPVGF
ncbi:M2 family metallopeptidase [bacterium]|nr:M2 family metallopeptidase [bacterium]